MKKLLLSSLLASLVFPATNIPVGPWRSRGGPAGMPVESAGELRWGNAKDSLANGMLTGPFPAVTLADGQQVQVEGKLTLAGVDAAPAHQLRFGIFRKPAADTPNGWLGYVSTSAGTSGAGFILARTPTNKGGFAGAGGPGSGETVNLCQSKPATQALTSGAYVFQMSLARLGAKLRVRASLTDAKGSSLYAQEAVDAKPASFEFNQVGFMFGALLAADGLTLGAVKLETTAAVSTAPVGEPTNAAMAAQQNQKKTSWDLEADARRKSAMTPAELAWEQKLEANLGSFYLPIYKKDKARGAVTAWDYVADAPGLPRILIIGDSISRGYTLAVRKALSGKANVHRAPENCGPTANGLKKLDVYLGGEQWDVVTFNFSIHDRATPLTDYTRRLDEIATRLKATGAKILWVSGTPLDKPEDDEAQMVPRNRAAAELMVKHGIPVIDAYALMKPKLAEWQRPKDVHYQEAGYEALGAFLAKSILERLAAR